MTAEHEPTNAAKLIRLLRGIEHVISFARDAWRGNDGAEGDAVRRLCDLAEAVNLMRDALLAPRVTMTRKMKNDDVDYLRAQELNKATYRAYAGGGGYNDCVAADRVLAEEFAKIRAESAQQVTALTAERDEARDGYHALDRNWEKHHEACMSAMRQALELPEGSLRELVLKIDENKKLAAMLREHGTTLVSAAAFQAALTLGTADNAVGVKASAAGSALKKAGF